MPSTFLHIMKYIHTYSLQMTTDFIMKNGNYFIALPYNFLKYLKKLQLAKHKRIGLFCTINLCYSRVWKTAGSLLENKAVGLKIDIINNMMHIIYPFLRSRTTYLFYLSLIRFACLQIGDIHAELSERQFQIEVRS